MVTGPRPMPPHRFAAYIALATWIGGLGFAAQSNLLEQRLLALGFNIGCLLVAVPVLVAMVTADRRRGRLRADRDVEADT